MATESTRSDENPLTDEDLRQLLNGLLWYHTIDVRPGVTTKGWFDLRHALPLIPWPTITGRRCLDIGTWDGFYAFELERRGAAEVIALDVPDLLDIDFPPAVRGAANFDPEPAGKQRRSAGFHLLHEQLGSKVQWKGVNIYDVAQAGLGRFDVVVIGSLLVHLRDPVRALDAVRRVTDGYLVLIEFVHWPLEAVASRRPVAQLGAISEDFQWWLPSSSALRHMLTASGFEIVDESRPFLLREPDQPRPPNPSGRVRHAIGTAAKQVMTRDWGWHGHMHRAFLARPRSTSDA
jgi:tRNA (mo5U34)-methyltransferase